MAAIGQLGNSTSPVLNIGGMKDESDKQLLAINDN